MQEAKLKTKSILKIGNYRLGRTIGQGSFGKVKLAEHEVTGHKVAVKILNRSKIKALPRMDEKIRREIQILKLFRHSHIIRLYEVIETATDIFMVMEYVSGGELFEYIVNHGRLSEGKARTFFQQIISGVDYCHQHRIVHRDLKPENLLLDSSCDNVKIADFGLSNFMQDGDFLQTSCGSPNYAAPEVISGQLYAGPEVDIWSCGVILYALVCARLPFDDKNIPNLFKKIRMGAYTVPPHVSPECKQLIDMMLVVDPMARASISQIRAHPWFQEDLPAYLRYTSRKEPLTADTLDETVLQELILKFRVPRNQAMAGLLDRDGDMPESHDLQVAYDLIYDAKRMYVERDDFVVEKKAKDVLTWCAKVEEAKHSVYERKPEGDQYNNMWCLGITCTGHPNKIMAIVFQVLREHNYEWKVVTPYQVRCRQRLDPGELFGAPQDKENACKNLKIGIQLYKVEQDQFLLDFKKLDGDTFCFFNRCASLFSILEEQVEHAEAQ